MKGLVIKSTGAIYTVLIDGEPVLARLRGVMRLSGASSTSPVVVGDYVDIASEGADFVIEGVQNRKNYIVRRATNLSKQKHIIAANIDCLYLFVTLAEPCTPTEFIDRVLAAAEAYNVPAKIVVNKIDIAPPNELFEDIYAKAGYEVIKISAKNGTGIESLKNDIGVQTVLFTGNSGVGKSSVINAISPDSGARTGAISAYHHKGMHTTTFSEIFALCGGGYVIDTPGIKGFGLVDIASDELYHYFKEIMAHSADCNFYNCTHTHEPGCAVQLAVEQGQIAEQRYDNYCKMMSQEQEKYRK